jgi:predicted O-methyltransferase YrrM
MEAGTPIAQRIANRIDEIYARRVVLGDDGRPYDIGLTSVSRRRGEFVAGLVRTERPRATLEVGMAWGLSTLFILQVLFENGDEFRPHVVIDPFQSASYHNAALRSINELGLADKVEFIGEPSELALPQLVQQKRRFDLAFIDGAHLFDYVFTDLRFVHLMLKPGGLVIFDDANWDPVHLACRFAETNYGYQPVADDRGQQTHRRKRLFRPEDRRRPSVRAYRKPMQPLERAQGHLAPFFDDFRAKTQVHGGELRHKGLMALAAGDRIAARRNFRLALSQDPTHFKTYFRLIRTYLPLNIARALSASSHRTAQQSPPPG